MRYALSFIWRLMVMERNHVLRFPGLMHFEVTTCYGMHAMLELAESAQEDPISVSSIACSRSIPQKYLEQVMARLKACGLVLAVGKLGYRLAKQPNAIRLSEIIRAMRNSDNMIERKCIDDSQICCRADTCPGHSLWEELNRIIDEKLSQVFLADIMSVAPCGETESSSSVR